VAETEDSVYCAEVGKVELDVLKFKPSMDLGGVEDIVSFDRIRWTCKASFPLELALD